jgi:hypothetical protein
VPDITELLRDAAPTPRPFDEVAVRRRVGRRRRRRYEVLVAALVGLAGVGVTASMLARDPAEQAVLTQESPVASGEVTALTLVHDDVWTAGDGFVQAGDVRTAVDGTVVALLTGDLVWAVGDTWVQALDDTGAVAGPAWHGDRIGGAQPLPDGRLAVTQPDTSRVLVLGKVGDATGVLESIEVVGAPTDLVLTLSNQLWVDDGDVICRIDFDAGTAPEEQPWSGPLLAPSRSGGIWTTELDRVVELFPENLDVGQSMSLGERYIGTGTMAVETSAGLYVGGPEGLSRHDAEGGEVLDLDEPDALAGNDALVVYLVDGEVRRAHAEVAHVPDDPETATEAIGRYVTETFGWPDPVVVPDGRDGYFDVATATFGRDALIGVDRQADGFVVDYVWTFGDDADDGGVAIGVDGPDAVAHPYAEPGLTPELTVTYGDRVHTQVGEIGAEPYFEFDLGFVPDVPGSVQILYRDADGVVLEALLISVPAGPFAAG